MNLVVLGVLGRTAIDSAIPPQFLASSFNPSYPCLIRVDPWLRTLLGPTDGSLYPQCVVSCFRSKGFADTHSQGKVSSTIDTQRAKKDYSELDLKSKSDI